MPETATPKGTESEGSFTYGRDNQGNLLVGGFVVEREGVHDYELPDPEVEDKEAEAVEEQKVAETPVKSEEAKEPAKPETAPEPEIQKPPDRQKFKLKVQGEEIERELTQSELIARLQMAEDYQRKTTDLAEQRRKIEPFMPIIEKPEFKQWLSDQVEAGLIEAPKPPPPPAPEDVVGYRLREQEPEFNDIRRSMAEWAATLPAYEADILASNHKAFNDAYDRFKAAREARKPAHPPPAPPADPKTLDRIIQSKEVSKDKAKIEPPGGTIEEVDPMKEWKRIDRELRRAVQNGERSVRYRGRSVDPETAWAMHRFTVPEQT